MTETQARVPDAQRFIAENTRLLTPPLVPVEDAAGLTSWLSVSSKTTALDLYPGVLTLAMLLDTTSMSVWC